MARRRHDNSLSIYYSKRERDLVFWHDKHAPDGHLMHNVLNATPVPGCDGRTFVQELEHRGFDVKTLRFSILRKQGT